MAQRELLRYGRPTMTPILTPDTLSWRLQSRWRDLLSSHTTNSPVQQTLRLMNIQYPHTLQHPIEASQPILKCHKRLGPLRYLQKKRTHIRRKRCTQRSLLHTKRNNLPSRLSNPKPRLLLSRQDQYQSRRTKWSTSPEDKLLLPNSLRPPPLKYKSPSRAQVVRTPSTTPTPSTAPT